MSTTRKKRTKTGKRRGTRKSTTRRRRKGARRGSVMVGAAKVLHFGDLTKTKVKNKKRMPKHSKCTLNGKDPKTGRRYYEVRHLTGKALVKSRAAEARRKQKAAQKHGFHGPLPPPAQRRIQKAADKAAAVAAAKPNATPASVEAAATKAASAQAAVETERAPVGFNYENLRSSRSSDDDRMYQGD